MTVDVEPSSRQPIEPDVAARLDLAPVLRDRHTVEPLPGGITNRNFRVTTPAGDFVARISSTDSNLLAIDRDAEYHNSVAAAQAGVGAPVVDYIPDEGILVIAFIEGRAFTAADVQAPANLPRLATACRKLHSGPRFRGDFNMFRLQEQYLALVNERGFRLPPGYEGYAGRIGEIEGVLQRNAVPTVPCNNDLLAGNIIDDGERLWLIDYEYAGNNDPFFELGNMWSESALTLPLLDTLVEAYVGTPSPRLVARAWLWALTSKYGWTLWASIQAGSSSLDFDFWSWGMEKYERAVAELESPELARFLEEAMADSD